MYVPPTHYLDTSLAVSMVLVYYLPCEYESYQTVSDNPRLEQADHNTKIADQIWFDNK